MPLLPFRPKCPIESQSQAWVDARMKWLAGQFGMPKWRTARAVEPTEEFFPDRFDGSEDAVRRMLDRVCGFMGVAPGRVTLQLYAERPKDLTDNLHVAIHSEGKATAGHYRVEEKEIVGIEASKLNDPMSLVATIAHELAHVRLLGERRLTGKEEDHEPLTDLTTVFFGLGIFNANSVCQFDQWAEGGWHGWKASKQGYLNERMFGYALALWTTVRNEDNPPWMRHLRTNPRTYMKQAVKFLRANPPGAF